MSQRIVTYEDQLKLSTLLNDYKDQISADTKANALKNIDDNKVWIASQKFLDAAAAINDYVKMLDDVENQLRLPKTSVPSRYYIHIDARNLHSGDKAYSGEVTIETTVKVATDYIMIHSRGQEIDELKVLDGSGATEIPLFDYHLFPAADTLTIYFVNEIRADTDLKINIKYSTIMTTYEAGFYQTSYTVGGVTKYLGATQFQASDGRFAFPHYDEPEYKAVFELKITHHESLKAISNTMGTNETE